MSTARLDFLKELGNIGAGHATAALSRMLGNERFELVVPEAAMLSFGDAWDYIGGPEQVVAGIYIQVMGDAHGHMAFILPVDSALRLVEILVGGETAELDEMGLSALEEVGNIMVASYLNALSDLTGMRLMPSVPAAAVDMAGAVWQTILAGAAVSDTLTLIKTEFMTDSVAIGGHILFLPDEEGFQIIARRLGLEEL